jgi:hypothetical protein
LDFYVYWRLGDEIRPALFASSCPRVLGVDLFYM